MTDEELQRRFEFITVQLGTLVVKVDQLAEVSSKHEARLSTLEQSFQTLVQLTVSASERDDQQMSWINQLGTAQAEATTKIAALTDAQIRTEDSLKQLATAQTHTDRRLDALIDIVRGGQS